MASAVKCKDSLQLIKCIANELRLAFKDYKKADAATSKIEDSLKHMFKLSRGDQETKREMEEEQSNRPQNHYHYLAQTYLTYLESTRLHEELNQKYFSKGELSVQDSARLVGLEVPKRCETTKADR